MVASRRRPPEDREYLARRRLIRVLARHTVAIARTLEQKISDAGPYDQRIDPHVLTRVRNQLVEEGQIGKLEEGNTPWYYVEGTPEETVVRRQAEQLRIVRAIAADDFGERVGQALEIAIYRALMEQRTLDHLGSFRDLAHHDDSTLYSKIEPPEELNGRVVSNRKRLDFLVRHPEAGWAGIEAKNFRQWLYPRKNQIVEMIGKSVELNCVPVLIGRRIPFVTFKILNTCGVVIHQTYNQLYPEAEGALADQARHKRLLGYHDIRTGNQPDERLRKFIGINLADVLPEARERFDEYKDLLDGFGNGAIAYEVFAARVRRRSQGQNEDNEWDEFEE